MAKLQYRAAREASRIYADWDRLTPDFKRAVFYDFRRELERWSVHMSERQLRKYKQFCYDYFKYYAEPIGVVTFYGKQ